MAKKAATTKKAATRSRRALYAVRWRVNYYSYYDGSERTQPGSRYVKAFTSPRAAREYIEALHRGEVAAPAGANPFMSFRHAARSRYFYGDPPELGTLTSFPEPVFLDYVRDLGLTPPPLKEIKRDYGQPYSLRDWDGWWEEHAPHLTDDQRARLWKALDRLEFYEIVPTELVQ
jgi:hypothetical protein